MFYRFCMAVSAAALWLSGSAGVAAERLRIFTVNYPLQYFTQRIAGDHAEVVLPVPPDVDPAFWQPDAAAIGSFQRADVILLNGAGYAKWISRVSLPRRKLVDTSAGFRDRYIETEGGATHSHGREGAHSHAGTAFTTWLDFKQAVQQARAVHTALSRLMPEQANTFAANLSELERDLLDLDARLEAIVARDPAKPLLASHPVYQYLARRYSLNLKSVMWEPDAVAPETEWQGLAELRETHPAAWMLWEAEPGAENRGRLQDLGVQSAVFDPCANRPAAGDFLSVMSDNMSTMAVVYDQPSDNEHGDLPAPK
jgi:zinc transport system substrate-binding protein